MLGGESWRLSARLAKLTQNTGWSLLADRQLEHLIQASGVYAASVRKFANAYKERLASTP